MPVEDLPNLCLECSVACMVEDAGQSPASRVATAMVLAGLCLAFFERKQKGAAPTLCVFCQRTTVCATHADPEEGDEVPS